MLGGNGTNAWCDLAVINFHVLHKKIGVTTTADVVAYCEREYAKVGEVSRHLGVRMSMHPTRFVLASDNDEIVERSIEEFEYRVNGRWMGSQTIQDFKCNVHHSTGIRIKHAVNKRLSPSEKNNYN